MGRRWALVWAAMVACSPNGGPEGGATCRDPQSDEVRNVRSPDAGALEITEWMANPQAVADEVGEWIELHAQSGLDLNALTLEIGTTSQALSVPDCLALEANQYAVLAREKDPSRNGGLPAVAFTFRSPLSNASGTLRFLEGKEVLDQVSWTRSSEGASTQREEGCPPRIQYGAGDRGTPGLPNDPCLPDAGPQLSQASGTCLDPISGEPRPIQWPARGDLTITEFLPNPAFVADQYGEFVELLASDDLDLNGLRLGNGTSSQTLSAATCLHLPAGNRALLARSAEASLNGGLPTVIATFGLSLGNDGDRSISLGLPDGGVLDDRPYQGSSEGKSWQWDGRALCLTQDHQFGGGDWGTPSEANELCP